jgi:hypothetical protein
MAPDELRDALRRTPFEPFRLVMTDGTGFEIRHPDLLLVGQRSAVVGLTGDPAQTYYERTMKVDLLHVIRLEPVESQPPASKNGPAS